MSKSKGQPLKSIRVREEDHCRYLKWNSWTTPISYSTFDSGSPLGKQQKQMLIMNFELLIFRRGWTKQLREISNTRRSCVTWSEGTSPRWGKGCEVTKCPQDYYKLSRSTLLVANNQIHPTLIHFLSCSETKVSGKRRCYRGRCERNQERHLCFQVFNLSSAICYFFTKIG